MRIHCVTFTGADDSVRPEAVLRVAEKYPTVKVEWALLLSKVNEGKGTRFPSLGWMEEFLKQAPPGSFAGHVQGRWLRALMLGSKDSVLTDRPTLCEQMDGVSHIPQGLPCGM